MKAERFVEVLSTWTTRRGALHVRLSEAITEAIRQGALVPGVRLPAERSLAHALSLSRTTVVTAYRGLRERGWLESRAGSGTWVSRLQAAGARSDAYSSVVLKGTLLNLLQANDPSLIDFSMATPEPLAEMVEAATERAREEIGELMRQRNYMPFGLHSLRRAVAEFYTSSGTRTAPEQILITTGAQQGISLIATLLVSRGDPALVESPTYFGALEALRFAGARISPVAMTKDHVAPEALLRKIAAVRPRLIYLTPTWQNPTGALMPTSARQQIARDAEEHEVPIVEDETLADMTIRGSRPASISAYSSTAPILGLGSLSKLMCSGLRIGWVRGPVPLMQRLAKVKSTADLGSSLMTQAIATELFSRMGEARALRAAELRAKRDLVAGMIRSRGLNWSFEEPEGGMSLWLRMPQTDTQLLMQTALRHGVTLAPGNRFSADESHREFLRLPFLLNPESLVEGVERLIAAWQELNGSRVSRPTEYAMV